MTEATYFEHVDCPPKPPFHYTACGLDNVYLTSGYTVEEHHGECFVAVKDAEELHAAIAEALVTRKKVLDGAEVRFLRKLLAYTQARLASMLGLTAQQVARYEKGASALEGAADTLLRGYVICKLRGETDLLAEIERIRESDEPSRDHLTLVHTSEHEWKMAA